MKYVFFGSPRFAEIILERLLEAGLPPVAIVCNPDRPVGRKKIVTSPPTKLLALAYGHTGNQPIKVFQPEALDEEFINELKALSPDIFVVAAYAKIIPKEVLGIPAYGTIGVHPSLLPKYRGASPIQSTILAGDDKAGTTLYLMDERMDHGPIISRIETRLDSLRTDYHSLERELAILGADLLTKALRELAENGAGMPKIAPEPQDDSKATYTKKFSTDDARVEADEIERAEKGDSALAALIVRKINAFSPEPGAWTMRGGKRIKLLKASIENGVLKLLLTQKEGEKPRKE